MQPIKVTFSRILILSDKRRITYCLEGNDQTVSSSIAARLLVIFIFFIICTFVGYSTVKIIYFYN